MDAYFTDKETGYISRHRTKIEGQKLPESVAFTEFNRRKGAAEYSDLTRPTHPRWSTAYHNDLNHNTGLFKPLAGPVTTFVDVMIRQGMKP